jgi:hypothetical protein
MTMFDLKSVAAFIAKVLNKKSELVWQIIVDSLRLFAARLRTLNLTTAKVYRTSSNSSE